MTPVAQVLVFPHHGGAPGAAAPGMFAEQISTLVTPDYVIFSIHRTHFDLPREDVLAAILKICPNAKLLCTQLPERLVEKVQRARSGPWCLHHVATRCARRWWDGHIQVTFKDGFLKLGPCSSISIIRHRKGRA